MSTNVALITGGTGFIGHFLVKEFLKDHKIICIVRPGTKNLARLDEVKDFVTFIEHDIKKSYDHLYEQLKDVTLVLHAGGNPSTEDSIHNPQLVIEENVLGTFQILQLARKLKNLRRFFYYAAAEVFGPIPVGTDSHPNDAFNCVSPYGASKAGGEELCVSYSYTFGVPVSITHITNTFGQRSQTKRFPVIAIRNILNDEPVTIHTSSDGTAGGRRWFHAGDVALHTRFILDHQKNLCEKWNSSGQEFIDNAVLTVMIGDMLKKKPVIKFESLSRVGHEPYFSISPSKLYELGWVEPVNMEGRLDETVQWYKNNREWLSRE
jgi:dTDP-glucose 4,6-dehydratase